jgi:hypothetical protein
MSRYRAGKQANSPIIWSPKRCDNCYSINIVALPCKCKITIARQGFLVGNPVVRILQLRLTKVFRDPENGVQDVLELARLRLKLYNPVGLPTIAPAIEKKLTKISVLTCSSGEKQSGKQSVLGWKSQNFGVQAASRLQFFRTRTSLRNMVYAGITMTRPQWR